MTFSAIHIVLAFAVGFFLGAIFGTGVHQLRKQPKPIKQPQAPVPVQAKKTPRQPVQTLDIPSIQNTNPADNSDSISMNALTPAAISSLPDGAKPTKHDAKSSDDATVLMQRPPPK